jgi:hypothetical protein
MFGPIWLARHTFRGVSRRRYCGQTDADTASAATHLKILVVITSPIWVPFGFFFALGGLFQLCAWLTTVWHRGPWYAATITAGAVAVAGAFIAHQLHRRATRRQQLITGQLSPRVSSYHPCCGMPTNAGHANTCWTNRQPPENPAKWSNRR